MSELQLSINTDSLLAIRDGEWWFSNARMRTHFVLPVETAACLARFTVGKLRVEWEEAFKLAGAWDCTEGWTGSRGLFADHSGRSEERGEFYEGSELLDKLIDACLLVEGKGEDYRSRLRAKASLLDRKSLGSFHQRVGQYVLLSKRERDRWRWWQSQKYTECGKALKPGPYRSVQEAFFDRRFKREDIEGRRVLDFGCGNGYYSRKFSDLGAEVYGVDTNELLVATAKENHGNLCSFNALAESSIPQFLAELENGAFDLIFMQDTLMLILLPEEGGFPDRATVVDLFKRFRSLLKATGALCTMEPNSMFWPAVQMGDPERPYALISEYQSRLFNVSPNLYEILEYMKEAGLGLVSLEHPSWGHPEEGSLSQAKFVNEYAMWDFLCFACTSGKPGLF